MGGVGDHELRLAHGLVDPGHGDLALAPADRGLALGRAFAFLGFVANVLKAHAQAQEAADPLDRKVDQRDQHQPRGQHHQQREHRPQA
jgi:hypothetical protein